MTFSTIDDFYVDAGVVKDGTPSRIRDNVSREVEEGLRRYGCALIVRACLRLELPTSVACTAQVLLHRFYCKHSVVEYDVRVMSVSAFWLACKLEEVIQSDKSGCLTLRDVLVMFYDGIRREENGGFMLLDIYGGFYVAFKDAVVRGERDMLRCFGFVTHVEHAHPFVLSLGAQLGLDTSVLQTACNIVNDSLRTTLCVRVKAHCVACAALLFAARRHGHGLPHGWWYGCGVEWKTIRLCCEELIDLYESHRDGDAYISVSDTFLKFETKDAGVLLQSKTPHDDETPIESITFFFCIFIQQ
ncbi:hypothetical protein M9434_003418 [Picochlorum sp. BPE23]|nr:hypothetical protein M9434_003418 [Picochlorum sp. BPE23]